MKKVSLEELLKNKQSLSYLEQVDYINYLIEKNLYLPVKASKHNGKKPALYLQYWKIEVAIDYSKEKEELLYHTHPSILVNYYLEHLDIYQQERTDVRLLNDYLNETKDTQAISINERSFEIFHKEKYLSSGNGKTILKHCGLTLENLNIYPSVEPFAYYTYSREVPQNLLILENKDPFYSMRRFITMNENLVLNTRINTLIYGAGKRVNSTFKDFELSSEPYMLHPDNQYYYFGDLDYEGILIFETLHHLFNCKPFIPAYQAMLEKAKHVDLPLTKDGQNRNISHIFFDYFEREDVEKMKFILEAGKYIPQEILNYHDF